MSGHHGGAGEGQWYAEQVEAERRVPGQGAEQPPDQRPPESAEADGRGAPPHDSGPVVSVAKLEERNGGRREHRRGSDTEDQAAGDQRAVAGGDQTGAAGHAV